MQAFTTLSAIAAPLPILNIDTDMIIPKQFLTTIQREGLGAGLFYEMRYDMEGNRNEEFILHRAPFTEARILVARDNFGCGSSREHAPWALNDFGIRCIIAPSFADIFYGNCFKNGMLPVVLSPEEVETLLTYAQTGHPLTVDLPNQTVMGQGIGPFHFEVDAFRKHCLLNGLDDIGLTLEHAEDISRFEGQQQGCMPWLYRANA